MPQIEIDFEVFKELTNRRPTESVTYNDVIRDLLGHKGPGLKTPAKPNGGKPGGKPWVVSDTSFPEGSEFMADYKGVRATGVVRAGKLELSDGAKFTTPSAAAGHVTHGTVNGWRFWKCKLPSAAQFVLLERLRGKAH